MLFRLSAQDLGEELGISNVTHQDKILEAVAALRNLGGVSISNSPQSRSPESKSSGLVNKYNGAVKDVKQLLALEEELGKQSNNTATVQKPLEAEVISRDSGVPLEIPQIENTNIAVKVASPAQKLSTGSN